MTLILLIVAEIINRRTDWRGSCGLFRLTLLCFSGITLIFRIHLVDTEVVV